MQIKLISGEDVDSITIDGVEERDMTNQQRADVLAHIMRQINPIDLSVILPPLMEIYADYDYEERTGLDDPIDIYTWTV